jgi:hypothetical protein
MGALFFISLLFCCTQASWLGDWAAKTAATAAARALGFPTTDTCGYTRDEALLCIKTYIDLNEDGEISESEFQYAQANYLPPRMRTLQWAVKKLDWDYTLKNIMPACDANKDGKLTLSDWVASKDTCLPGKADLCKIQYVCSIAKKRSLKK